MPNHKTTGLRYRYTEMLPDETGRVSWVWTEADELELVEVVLALVAAHHLLALVRHVVHM